MMPTLSPGNWAVLAAYAVLMGLLAIYGFHRFLVVKRYRRYYKKGSRADFAPSGYFADRDLPRVTIQLPCYNEVHVVERLINATAQIDYPADRLEIQVLDDSSDETTAIARRQVDRWRALGVDIKLVRRGDRVGYKAGALSAGLVEATGDLIAIFDADFIPPQNFLRDTVHYFTDPQVGVVQCRWSHVNREYSMLTQFQSIVLDAHHQLEQTSRCYSGLFFTFNGSGGIWRRRTIEEAGGWEHDTLTEDTDLSYRAQLLGWRFIYLPSITTPAELPVDMYAYRAQQRRWIVGTLQCARKLLRRIWNTPQISFWIKLEASYQLTGNLVYFFTFIISCLAAPLLIVLSSSRWLATGLIDVPLFFASFGSVFGYYFEGQRELFPSGWSRRAVYLPGVAALYAGMAPASAAAVLTGLFGHATEFIRTSKYGALEQNQGWRQSAYARTAVRYPIIESALGVYFVCCAILAVHVRRYFALPFILVFVVGSFFVAYEMITRWRTSRADQHPACAQDFERSPARKTVGS
jgi:cellulose synthase/poly-beta-1,6-N-acetylglucosamine synthase-like glycosyltransferase